MTMRPVAGVAQRAGTTTGAGTPILEHGPYARLYALTQRLAAGADGPYDLAQAILRARRATAPPTTSRRRPRGFPLASFLFNERRGYCQQFSGTMALMLRMAGIPARVASGFSARRAQTPSAATTSSPTPTRTRGSRRTSPLRLDHARPDARRVARALADQPTPPAAAPRAPRGRHASRRPGLGQSGDRPFSSGDPARASPRPRRARARSWSRPR